jgi:hypothetical protein
VREDNILFFFRELTEAPGIVKGDFWVDEIVAIAINTPL